MDNAALTVIFSLLSAAFGAYLGAYLKKVGEGHALREQFAEVKQQLRETTLATEDIKRKLTSELWLEQERWKLKKDLYITMLHSLEEALEGVRELAQIAGDPARMAAAESDGSGDAFGKRMDEISRELRKAKAMAKLVGARAAEIFEDLETSAFEHLDFSELDKALDQSVPIYEAAYRQLVEAGRADLVLTVGS